MRSDKVYGLFLKELKGSLKMLSYDIHKEHEKLRKVGFRQQAKQDSLIRKIDQHYATMNIPNDIALSICKDMRQPLLSISCLGCLLFSKENMPRRLKSTTAGYCCGCSTVGRHYALSL